MSDTPVLYGFNGSTYVRTIRMLLHEKGVPYDQVPVNVLEGEPRGPEHLKRHPFGKVPVLDIDGLRLRETIAIAQYLDETVAGPTFTPMDPKDRARMTEIVALTMSYGYDALVGWCGYHIFPDFCGIKTEEQRAEMQEEGEKFLRLVMEIRDGDSWLVGEKPTLADLFLAPLCAYVVQTPEKEAMLKIAGVEDWWNRVSDMKTFKDTAG